MSDLQLGTHYLKNGLYLAHASNASYRDDPTDSSSYGKLGLSDPDVFKTSDSGLGDIGFVAHVGQNVVVAIRGTDDIEDWKSNVDFTKISRLGSKVHKGFWEGMQGILDPILTAIRRLDYQGKTLWLTGHSRGGGLATLLAQQLYKKFSTSDPDLVPKNVFTFGAPRVGNLEFYYRYKLRTHPHKTVVFINESDPVPNIPPRDFDFTHVNHQELLLKNRVRNKVDVDNPTLPVLFDRGFPDFGDHSIADGYIANIEGNL